MGFVASAFRVLFNKLLPLIGFLIVVHFACAAAKSCTPHELYHSGVNVIKGFVSKLWTLSEELLPKPVAAVVTVAGIIFLCPCLAAYYGPAILIAVLSHPVRYAVLAATWLANSFASILRRFIAAYPDDDSGP